MAAPVVTTARADVATREGLSVDIFVPDSFGDPDVTDSLTYQIISGLPGGSNLSMNSTTGEITGTPNQADQDASPMTLTIRVTDESLTSIDVTAVLSAVLATPAAAEFYVDAASGDDANAGTVGAPWATLTRANQVGPDAAGHVDIKVKAGGSYRNQVIDPINAGLDANHKIRWVVDGVGLVTLLGPTSGQMAAAITLNRAYCEIGAGFVVDGEVDNPSPTDSRIKKSITTSNVAGLVIAADTLQILAGFNCNEIRGVGTVVKNGTVKLCGSPDAPTPQADRSDGLVMLANEQIVENYESESIGHYHFVLRGQRQIMRDGFTIASWRNAGVRFKNTVDAEYLGNHCIDMGGAKTAPYAEQNVLENWIVMGQRKSYVDENKNAIKGTKAIAFEGNQPLARLCYLIDGDEKGFSSSARSKIGGVVDDARLAHCTIDGLDGAAIFVTIDAANGGTSAQGHQYKNIAMRNCSRTDADGVDVYINIQAKENPGEDSLEGLVVAGCRVPAGARVKVELFDSSDDIRTLAQWQIDEPTHFFDNIIGDFNYAAADVNSTRAQVPANYALEVGDAGINGGVDLTTANGAGVASTTLIVNDAKWFIDNRNGPDPAAGAYQVNLAGVDVDIVSVDYASNTIELAVAQTWLNGAAVNYPYNGAAPNIGATQ